ncbi:uncharacterized protein LOC108485046 [Gossypium arboreum]|uniref:uncharacterized protein LOC108485046 n=1 Tax=Gossypium arboreum TaxID=29729 RepID=UPI0008196341|nr:uncharacterized protein LOC108485046 [Gossypium arboreum]
MARDRNDPGLNDPLNPNGQDVDLSIHHVIDDRDRPISEHVVLILGDLNLGIVKPHIQAQHFELKSMMFQMFQTLGQFSGLPTANPRLHLRLFLEFYDSFRQQGVPEDAQRLKLFPYSLRDRARAWLNVLPSRTVAS